MNYLKAAISNTPTSVNFLGIGSLALLLVKILWLDTIPAPIPIAFQFGDVAEALLGGTVAAYIFFETSIQIPRVQEKRRLGNTIVRQAERIANRVTGFLQMIADSQNKPTVVPKEVNLQVVLELFNLVSPSSVAPMLRRDALNTPLNWLAAMAFHDEQCQEQIEQLWRFAPFLDTKLIILVNEILFGSALGNHVSAMEDVRTYHLKPGVVSQNTNLCAWAKNYYACYDSARRIQEYCHQYKATFWLND